MELDTTDVDDQAKEAADAKLYWGQPATQPLFYDQTSHYAVALAELIRLTGCRTVFEFGCAAGRNLAAIQTFLSDRGVKDVVLAGVDINTESVEMGRQKYGLEIELGDENYLATQRDNSVDLVFTVSVLDHLPQARDAVVDLVRMARRYVVLLEPDPGADYEREGKIERILTGWTVGNVGAATPFTYLHQYRRIIQSVDADLVMELPFPTHLNKVGPLYRLFLLRKRRAEPPKYLDADKLRGRMTSLATLQLLRVGNELRMDKRKLKSEIEIAKRQLERQQRQLEHQKRQLEHQKRVTATAQSRLQQAQTRLKQQEKGLRQELGWAVEKSLESPVGIFRLPFRVAKAYRRARQRANFGAGAEHEARRDATAGALAHEAPAVARTKTPPPARQAIPHRDVSSAFPPYPFPERPPRSNVRVATVLDEFSDACWRYEANLVRLTKETWRAQIEREQPHFLLVESAWRGNRENWRGLIKHAGHTRDNPLEGLVRYCNSRGIPTVFWNKEDPPNFEGFIDAAAQFDRVFTTDANCIERYRDRLGHERIAALPFAAQPALHNPIGKQEADDYEIAFAGTWYGQKHEERGALLPILLDAATAHHLHIFDRMSEYTQNDCYRFPDKYAPFLRTALAYPNVLSAYRNFKLFLNVNSVTDSPTMFARRVFEILACSTAVVSTASSGIEQMLGDVVALVHDEDEARAEFDRLLSDPAHRQRKAHLGYRKVTQGHTYAARFRTIARTIGLDLDLLRDPLEVSVVIPLADQRWFENALANLRRQRHAPLEPVWVLRGAGSGLAERIAREHPSAVIIEAGAEAPLEAMLRCGIEASRSALVSIFDPRDLYGAEFIGDLVLAMSYADAEMVGKGAYFTARSFDEAPAVCQSPARYRYLDEVMASAWLARRDFVRRVGLDQILRVEDGGRPVVRANGSAKIYGADPYNYLRLADTDPTCTASGALAESGGPLGMRHPDVII
jgi:SAM-dependent methyltransferase